MFHKKFIDTWKLIKNPKTYNTVLYFIKYILMKMELINDPLVSYLFFFFRNISIYVETKINF